MDILEKMNAKFNNTIYQARSDRVNECPPFYQSSNYINDCTIKFADHHLLQPSLFPNGSVCGHLHEIRSINFTTQCSSYYCRKINVNPVNLKLKTI